jgi:hypothetical protein
MAEPAAEENVVEDADVQPEAAEGDAKPAGKEDETDAVRCALQWHAMAVLRGAKPKWRPAWSSRCPPLSRADPR